MRELLKVTMLKLTLPLECLFLDSSRPNDCCSSGYVSGFPLCALGFVAQSCPTFATPWTVAHQAPLPMASLQARILE